MSYDIAISVKVEGCDQYVVIDEPEYHSPTYNLGAMFRACMDWNYSQSEKNDRGEWEPMYYRCDFVLDRVERGLYELNHNLSEYVKYNAPNGWGTVSSAVKALESLRICILENAERIPLECLYMNW